MCEPMTVLAVSGGVLAAYSQYQQGQYAEKMGEYNAKVSEMKAADAIKQGGMAEEQQRARVRQVMGAQRAEMGASGMQADTGSFGDILADTAKYGELDALTARSNAMRQAWGFQQEAEGSRSEGLMASRAGKMNAFGTLLTTGAKAYSTYKGK